MIKNLKKHNILCKGFRYDKIKSIDTIMYKLTWQIKLKNNTIC